MLDRKPPLWRRIKFLRRFFPHRNIIVRQEGVATSFSMPTALQAFLTIFSLLLFSWVCYTSYFYVKYERIVARKNQHIDVVRTAYLDLLKDVAVYRDHIADISSSLDKNRSELLALIESQTPKLDERNKIQKVDPFALTKISEFDNEKERLNRENERLNSEILHIRGGLSVLADGNFLRDAGKKNSEISLRKALLQRDLATTEAEELKERVHGLEELIAQMQDTQIMAFKKMADIADGGIETIERRLSGVKNSLSSVGLGIETLLGRLRRDNANAGVGGPFIPVPTQTVRPTNLNISLASLNQRLNSWNNLASLEASLPIGVPLNYIRVTSPFGTRGDPFQGAPARHEAVDLGGIIGEPIYATAPGKIVRAGRWGWYGNMVEIDHGLGFRTRYAHMDKIFVTKGETVRVGDKIGNVGNSGRSTGPHLHYEIRVKGHAVDPLHFIKVGQNVLKNK